MSKTLAKTRSKKRTGRSIKGGKSTRAHRTKRLIKGGKSTRTRCVKRFIKGGKSKRVRRTKRLNKGGAEALNALVPARLRGKAPALGRKSDRVTPTDDSDSESSDEERKDEEGDEADAGADVTKLIRKGTLNVTNDKKNEQKDAEVTLKISPAVLEYTKKRLGTGTPKEFNIDGNTVVSLNTAASSASVDTITITNPSPDSTSPELVWTLKRGTKGENLDEWRRAIKSVKEYTAIAKHLKHVTTQATRQNKTMVTVDDALKAFEEKKDITTTKVRFNKAIEALEKWQREGLKIQEEEERKMLQKILQKIQEEEERKIGEQAVTEAETATATSAEVIKTALKKSNATEAAAAAAAEVAFAIKEADTRENIINAIDTVGFTDDDPLFVMDDAKKDAVKKAAKEAAKEVATAATAAAPTEELLKQAKVAAAAAAAASAAAGEEVWETEANTFTTETTAAMNKLLDEIKEFEKLLNGTSAEVPSIKPLKDSTTKLKDAMKEEQTHMKTTFKEKKDGIVASELFPTSEGDGDGGVGNSGKTGKKCQEILVCTK